jgi:hypothetical protein
MKMSSMLWQFRGKELPMVYDMRTVCMSAQDALRAGVCRRLLDGKLAKSAAT